MRKHDTSFMSQVKGWAAGELSALTFVEHIVIAPDIVRFRVPVLANEQEELRTPLAKCSGAGKQTHGRNGE